MKIVIIGDIHGRIIWKEIISREEDADYFVFLGDYFDPYDLSTPNEMYDNFKEILDFKMKNDSKVKLLVGNHDLHYICNISPCSRYSSQMAKILSTSLKQLVEDDILQLCWKIPNRFNIWCVHAGFTNTWLRDNRLQINEQELNDHFKNICSTNNPKNPYSFVYQGFRTDMYGDNAYQGPLWVRERSARLDCPEEMYQIVGHTQEQTTEMSKITICDSLRWKQYYVYEFDGMQETFIPKVIE